MKYYLLDYENVNAAGLDGLGELAADSKIILFYTRNSNKIDLGVVTQLYSTRADLSIIEVHHGKQALDIQLASYLGYLIGTEPADTEYYIISKDKGYRNVQSFWPDRHIVLCKNLTPDSEIVDEPAEEKKSTSRSGSRSKRRTTAVKASKSAGKQVEAKQAEAKQAEEKQTEETAAPEAEPNEPIVKPKTEPKVEPKVEPVEEKPAIEPKPNAFAEAAAIAKAVVEAKKNRNATETQAEKKKEPKAPKTKPRISDIRAEVNNEIQRILSKENFSGDVVNATASLVTKNVGKDGYKQTVYRGIIKENGQKQGLKIYRLTKDIL